MEKTEEQIAKDRAAVEAMRNAKANMETTLRRIALLESTLGSLIERHKATKKYIGADCYVYEGKKTVHSHIDEAVTAAQAAL
jgi:hypothetical protein